MIYCSTHPNPIAALAAAADTLMTRILYIGERDQMIFMEDAAEPERLAEAVNAGLRLAGMPPGELCARG
jgi:hypothetical protein